MADPQNALQLLKRHGFSFYWNEADKHWWVTQIKKNGKVSRTDPETAVSWELAINAAVSRYVK